MRFPKETRALIHETAPHAEWIPWPSGNVEPVKGRIYWLQSAEDLEAERKRREHSPETCAEVMGSMNARAGKVAVPLSDEEVEAEAEAVLRENFNGERRQANHAEAIARVRLGERPRRRRNPRAPLAGSERIRVIDVEIQDVGWMALVEIYEDPDPIRHLRVKAKVPAGSDPIDGHQVPTEVEPEQTPQPSTPQRRVEEEQALRIVHEASIDRASVFRAEQKLIDQRRKGRRSKLAEEAVERAKRRAEMGESDAA